MTLKHILLATLGLIAVSAPAHAQSSCAGNFADGKAPAVIKKDALQGARLLCFSEFAVLHSARTKTPIYSADHLTRARVLKARHQRRSQALQSFHDEKALPPGEGADLGDYVHSGYDRGHMTPNADMDNAQAQGESFSLANMIPQNANNNRNLWEGVEEGVRNLAVEYGTAYVVTIPIFSSKHTTFLHGRVAVPEQIAKAVYIPSQNIAAAYLTPNAAGQTWASISIATLRSIAGIDPYPGIPEKLKQQTVRLPEPIIRNAKRGMAW